ncbi:MAG: SpoIID/LytB domain-containing protein, partial [Acidimicrobiaceae bacterium]|nr:SpoIID/LytB domain-containing protein [Acidimicrobiaceae bacterium]
MRQNIFVLTAWLCSTTICLSPLPASATDSAEQSITFVGGGYGHGIGMSQYGALGRSEAGHTYDQILSFYYDGTVLSDVEAFGDGTTDFAEGADDIDVLLSVRTQVAVSTPLEQVGSWELEVTAGGQPVGTITSPLDATWDSGAGRWIAMNADRDLCDGISACENAPLELAMSGEEHVVLEQWANGPNIGKYRGGKIILHPAAVNGPKGTLPIRCGGGNSFCVIHGDLDLQEYLYGVSEIPFSWPQEALKAQVVAARSYAVSRILARNASSWPEPFDLYDSVSDQKYSGWDEDNYPGGWSDCADGTTWCAAVDATDDLIVDYEGEVAETFYSASNGGATAEPPDVWAGGTSRPYLLAKEDLFDSGDHNP